MGNQQSKKIKDDIIDGFVIIDYDLDEQSKIQEIFQLAIQKTGKGFVFTKTVIISTVCAIGSALSILGGITASASTFIGNSLAVKQDFQTRSQIVAKFEKISFFIVGKNLGFCIENRVCGFKFQLDISSIEMFHLTDEICLFLLHTTDENTVASVYTSQYNGDFNRLKLTKITDSGNQFERFEASEVCMYGTVSLTVYYKNGTHKFFRIERDGTIQEVVLP